MWLMFRYIPKVVITVMKHILAMVCRFVYVDKNCVLTKHILSQHDYDAGLHTQQLQYSYRNLVPYPFVKCKSRPKRPNIVVRTYSQIYCWQKTLQTDIYITDPR